MSLSKFKESFYSEAFVKKFSGFVIIQWISKLKGFVDTRQDNAKCHKVHFYEVTDDKKINFLQLSILLSVQIIVCLIPMSYTCLAYNLNVL